MKTFCLFICFCLISVLVFSQPVINSITPASGPVGTNVTITGNNFSSTVANNIVYFGAVKASISAANSTSLTVAVPNGSTYEPITVISNGLTAYSSQPFMITFPGSDLTVSSFAPKIDSGSGFWAEREVIADIDGDGKSDLLYTHSNNTVSIFRNTTSGGSISFAPKLNLTTNDYPSDLTISDLDGDSKFDIIITCGNGVLNIFRNTSVPGNFSFAPKINFSVPSGAISLAAKDFDRDGKPDIAMMASNSSYVTLYKNTSSGNTISFSSRVDFPTAGSGFSMTTGDLNGDNVPDLAIAGFNSSTLTVLLNTSTTQQFSFVFALTQYNQGGLRHIAIADFTGDNKNDMVVANISNRTLQLYRNTSTGNGISFASRVDMPVETGPRYLAVADMDGDTKPDLISANVNSASVSIYKNTSTTSAISFNSGIRFSTIEGESPYMVLVADLNEDSKPDIVANNYQSARLSILKNRMNESSNCTGTFTATATVVDQPCGAYGIGEVTINTTGGNGTIQYSLDGGVFRYSNVLLLNAGTYSITAKDEGGCTTSVSFTINIAASPIIIATSPTTIECGSTTTSVTITASGGTEPYIYSLNGGNYQSSNIFQNLTAGNYEISVRDSTECTNTLAFTVAQSSPPNLTIVNPQAVCAPATVDLTASSITTGSDAGLSYTYWTNAEATNALNNPSTVSATGTYYIKGITANGCFSIKPVIATVVNQPPAPVITSNGSNNFCEGGTVTLSSSPADNYQWYKNNNLIAGATAQSYTVTSSGTYEVRTINSCATSNSNIITITVTPTPSITAIGATSFCQGSNVTLNSSAATGNQWYKNGIAITDATSQNYLATETGDYTVKVSNGSCTTTASNVITVAVHQIPAAPVISQSGNNLVSSETSGNKWYNNGTLIGGATNQTYEVTTPGVYTATVTLNGCTSVSSNSITISSVNTSSSLDSNVKTGPNPTINFLNIHYSGSSRSFVVVLSELSGRVLVTVEVFDKNYQLDMRAYRPGYYVLAITTPDNGDRIQRLIMKQ